MPTDEENVQYLYLVLTSSGPPVIDFNAVGKALDLKHGAVTKRWSRLKAAMNEGKAAAPSAYEFLWLCVKHSTREKAPDWSFIASKCNTTAGAASKRYSRMKQAFEKGDAVPSSKPTADNGASPAKRKRGPATPKKPKANFQSGENVEDAEDAEDDEDLKPTPKKVRTPAKPRAKVTPKPKGKAKLAKEMGMKEGEKTASVPPTEATTLIKTEAVEGEGEYYDAQEFVDGGEVGDTEGDEEVTQERIETWLDEMV
ncbi:hypothetical protein K505DRAFT_124034 [Melanomma pulvis-pyrius CBS 109.77]|uniref:Myb-like DNA-binding domain-containing protein n=1 Tax=Melanomma pulvis-pyrius CBS 109.77 TaxID=1314802 RepID=A0A6A6WUR4_9PLEO|nr:hypothetical protein K505DRAFT_124034 [Melanomma pulvis-pyrius CBS 109.77]